MNLDFVLKLRPALILVGFLFSAALVFAQDCPYFIKGQVVDEHDSEVLAQATVYLVNQQKGDYSNDEGFFEITGVCLGNDTLRISHLGCETVFVPVIIETDLENVIITLEHHSLVFDKVIVEAARNISSATDISEQLNTYQKDKTAGEDLSVVLEQLPGVSTISTGANIGRPLIDGLGGSRIQIVRDGIALSNQDWGDEHAPELDPFGAEHVQLSRSGNTLNQGNITTGGSLLIGGSKMPEHRKLKGQSLIHAASNARAFGAGFKGSQRIGDKFGYQVFTSFADRGDAKAPTYILSNTGSDKWSVGGDLFFEHNKLEAKLSYRTFAQETGILRAAHIGNLTDLNRALQSDLPLTINPFTRAIDAPRQEVNHNWLTAQAKYHLSSNDHLALQISNQNNFRKEYDIRRSGRSAIPALDMELTTNDLRLDYQRQFENSHTLKLGTNLSILSNRNAANTGVKPLIPFYDANRVGIFAAWTYAKANQSWNASLRINRDEMEAAWSKRISSTDFEVLRWDQTRWTSALSAGYARFWGNSFAFKANLAFSSRVPNPAERFAEGLHHSLAVIERGDTTLNIEQGLKASFSLEKETTSKLYFRLGGFAQPFQGFIYQQYLPEPELTIRGAFPVVAYKQADALLAGTDATVSTRFKTFNLELQSQYLYGQLSDGRPLPDIAPWTWSTRWSYQYRTTKRLKDLLFAARYQYVAQQSRVPLVLPRDAPSSFGLLGFEASAHLALQQNTLGLFLNIDNLLNEEYRNYLDRLRFFTAQSGINVQFRINYTF